MSLAGAVAVAGHLPPLLVAAQRVAATVLQGVHGRRRPGPGDSFWQYRPLLDGESAGRIDWRQSARSGRAYVRQSEWDAAQTVGLWRAPGRGMAWRSAPSLPTKQARAELLLLALASLLMRAGEQIRLLGDPGPYRGRQGLYRLAERIGDDPPATPTADGLPRHATVLLAGDWLDPPEEARARLAPLAALPVRGHVLQVLDPAELDLPYHGRVRFEQPGRPRDPGAALIGRVEAVRAAYHARMTAHQDRLAALCRGAGFGWTVHRTDQPAQVALLALYEALAR